MKNKSKILLWLSLLSAVNSPARTSLIKKTQDKVQNNIVNMLSLDHEKIISMNISDLVEKYGREKTQEIVREHSLIEINKYKKWERYSVNFVLEKVAQNHANDMSKNNYFSHNSLDWKHSWDRVDQIWWYDYQVFSENISNDDCILDVVLSYVNSKKWWHEEIFENKYEDIGIGLAPIIDDDGIVKKYYFVFDFGKSF